MIETCQTFLADCLSKLRQSNDLPAYRYGAVYASEEVNVFFGELPRDYLKDHDLAVQCLLLQDRQKRSGRLIGRQRSADCSQYTFTRRRYRREVLYRVLLYAGRYEELCGGSGYIGLVDQLQQVITEAPRVLADAGNNAVRVTLQDTVRPWDSEIAGDRQKRRPLPAIMRIEFTGGIHTTTTTSIIPSVEIAADYQ